jgi:Protein of unknown function (DUF433)
MQSLNNSSPCISHNQEARVNGATRDEILKAYPVLEPEDIDACLLCAARLSELAAAEGLTVAAE